MDIKTLGKIDGHKVESYRLSNNKDMSLEILNFGGIIRELIFKGENRVLAFDSFKDYIGDRENFGAIVGPVAGRISGARFTIEDKTYRLDKNEGNNCLHSGSANLSKKFWTLKDSGLDEDGSQYLTLFYRAEDGEGGFPGNRDFFVKFSLTDYNELIIEYRVRTDKPSYVSLTNHSYFNLGKSLEDEIYNHRLWINANKFIRLNEEFIPIGTVPVDGTVFDFREEKEILRDFDLEDRDLKVTNGYDHPFILSEDKGENICLETDNIRLSIETSEPCVILYTSNALEKRRGVCLETQSYPDGMNHDFLSMKLLSKDEEYISRTKYRFE